MRAVHVFAEVEVGDRGQILALLHGRWRTATRLVMVLMSADGKSAAQIADLLGYHAGTVRRWLDRFTEAGIADLCDRSRSGRPPLGGTATDRPHRRTALPRPDRGRSNGCGSGWAARR
jgi:DNA-binding transcriptional ArsR family regulator